MTAAHHQQTVQRYQRRLAVFLFFVMTALVLQQPATSTAVALDFEFFRSKVQPIFLKKNPGHTRCVVCHSGEGRIAFLKPLLPNATTWDEKQSRLNFEAVSRLVTPGSPLTSRLLMHPLEPAAGGDEFYNGGRQFTSQDDPQFQTLSAWVLGQK